MLSVSPVLNKFITKTGVENVVRSLPSSLTTHSLRQVRPAFDVFETKPKSITITEVKKLFPTGKLDENNYVIREMKDVLSRIYPTPKKVIDLSPMLKEEDYKLITEMMNLHGGKHIEIWKGFSDTDLIPNIEKLALFNRSMRLSKQSEDFLQFNPEQWDVVVDGIVRKPKEAIVPLLEYKVNSDEINRALSSGKISPAVQKKIDAITNYINLFETKKDLTVYRGEKSFGLFDIVKTSDNTKLSSIFKYFDKFIKESYFAPSSLDYAINFIDVLIADTRITQSRFMSTAMTTKAANRYAEKIFWKIKVPAGTKGASIESFNIEREGEAEFLIQKGSMLKVKNINYNKKRKIWELESEIEQSPIIDNVKKNDILRIGV